ncbi:hypothetical protein [Ekhidna sp.]|uniref:hypothetical protein n=1 Tax=Ekhidna sp. TaxID=2608089 RepID=UPI0032973180
MKKYLTLILVAVSFLSHSQDGFETLDDAAFSIKYPGTWELNQSGQMGMSFALFSPVKFDGDQFRENVNLVVQDISSYNMDLTDFVNLSKNQIKTMIQDGNILESEGTEDYQKIIYTGTMGQFKLMFKQHYWINGSNAYILTFTAEQSEYDNYAEISRQIMDSFLLK